MRNPRPRSPSEVFDSLRFNLNQIQNFEIPIKDREQVAEGIRTAMETLLPYLGTATPKPAKRSK